METSGSRESLGRRFESYRAHYSAGDVARRPDGAVDPRIQYPTVNFNERHRFA